MGKNESSTFAIKKSERGLTEMSFCKAQSEKNCESDLVFLQTSRISLSLFARQSVTVNEQRVNDIFPLQIEYETSPGNVLTSGLTCKRS